MRDLWMRPIAAFTLLLSLSSGCSHNSGGPSATGDNTDEGRSGVAAAIASSPAHSHDGWWCDEHGVPEEMCGQCNSKLAAEFQKKGDWCKGHDCPESQCFACHPELEAKFAAQYEAKFGKKPPKPEG